MDDVPRRAVLTAGVSALAGLGVGSAAARAGRGRGKGRGRGRGRANGRGNGRIEEVVSVTDPVPENLGFDAEGNLYVGITGGAVRRLPADRTDETGLTAADLDLVAEYPGGVAGVLVADGTLYTAVNGGTSGVYAVDADVDGGTPELLAAIDGGFVNDLLADGDRLLVTESLGGVVYEVPRSGGEATVWSDSSLLDTPSFGANGITRIDDSVFVAVTRVTDTVGRIVRVPVGDDGSAGTAETYLEGEALFGADGLTARGPQLYVALNAQNRIARVTPSGRLQTVVEGGPLSFPSEVVFAPTARGRAFVCNFSNDAPERGGVLRTHP